MVPNAGEKTYDPRIRPSALNSSDGPTFIKVNNFPVLVLFPFFSLKHDI